MREKCMEYIVYKRFRGAGIDGEFNLTYRTVESEIEGIMFAADDRRISDEKYETR